MENLNKNHPHYTIYNTFSFFVSLYIFYVIFLCVKHVRTYSFTFCQYNIPGSIGTRFIVAWFVIIFLYIYNTYMHNVYMYQVCNTILCLWINWNCIQLISLIQSLLSEWNQLTLCCSVIPYRVFIQTNCSMLYTALK